MGSGGGGGGDPSKLMQNAAPMQGLPVAGKDSTIGSPFEYGQFQSFLPDIKAEGQNPMATGLRPDMFNFKSPAGVGGAGGGGSNDLRDALAQIVGGGGAGGGGGGLPGMGGGGGGFGGYGGGNSGFGGQPAYYPNGQTPVPLQGGVGGNDQYGRQNFTSGAVAGPVLDLPYGK